MNVLFGALAAYSAVTVFIFFPVSPSIDKGQAGSKTVRVNRTAFWQIRCRGEPPPKFTWIHPVC